MFKLIVAETTELIFDNPSDWVYEFNYLAFEGIDVKAYRGEDDFTEILRSR